VIRKARAVSRGSGGTGNGELSSESGVLASTSYSFRIRFENMKGANPEELMAAAHAGCFAMSLAFGSQDTEQNSSVSRVANLTARYLVVDVRTSQSIHSITDHPAHADPLIQQFERWARGRLAEGFSLDQAAEVLATSKRTLARRTQSVLGKSPLAYFQELRIERAVHLLRTSNASVDQIAAEVGYAEGVTLRALLRRKLGRGVREIRRGLNRSRTLEFVGGSSDLPAEAADSPGR
jgi:transcriptional regulator GlxA family with amidase domain